MIGQTIREQEKTSCAMKSTIESAARNIDTAMSHPARPFYDVLTTCWRVTLDQLNKHSVARRFSPQKSLPQFFLRC